jgi:hypothetical protein
MGKENESNDKGSFKIILDTPIYICGSIMTRCMMNTKFPEEFLGLKQANELSYQNSDVDIVIYPSDMDKMEQWVKKFIEIVDGECTYECIKRKMSLRFQIKNITHDINYDVFSTVQPIHKFISRFHFPCVRVFFDLNDIYVLPSFLESCSTGIISCNHCYLPTEMTDNSIKNKNDPKYLVEKHDSHVLEHMTDKFIKYISRSFSFIYSKQDSEKEFLKLLDSLNIKYTITPYDSDKNNKKILKVKNKTDRDIKVKVAKKYKDNKDRDIEEIKKNNIREIMNAKKPIIIPNSTNDNIGKTEISINTAEVEDEDNTNDKNKSEIDSNKYIDVETLVKQLEKFIQSNPIDGKDAIKSLLKENTKPSFQGDNSSKTNIKQSQLVDESIPLDCTDCTDIHISKKESSPNIFKLFDNKKCDCEVGGECECSSESDLDDNSEDESINLSENIGENDSNKINTKQSQIDNTCGHEKKSESHKHKCESEDECESKDEFIFANAFNSSNTSSENGCRCKQPICDCDTLDCDCIVVCECSGERETSEDEDAKR